MAKTSTRNRRNGQYTLSSGFDRVCKCGRTLGVHDAEAPHAFGDYSLDTTPGLPDCAGFKLDRKKAVA